MSDPDLIILEWVGFQQFYQFFIFSDGFDRMEMFTVMEVRTDEIYQFIFDEVFCCFLNVPAIVPGEGEQVDLEVAASLFEYFIVSGLLMVVVVTFRMCQDRAVALC